MPIIQYLRGKRNHKRYNVALEDIDMARTGMEILLFCLEMWYYLMRINFVNPIRF